VVEQVDETKRRRRAIIQAVKLFVMDNGYWPSIMDLSRETGIPETSTRRHVMMLVEQRVLQLAAGERGITLGLPDINETNMWRKAGDTH
tara:strand:- start:29 stop:295 length:267 start_codon:yes stop_codon:yes gene_type:complete